MLFYAVLNEPYFHANISGHGSKNSGKNRATEIGASTTSGSWEKESILT